MGIYIEVENVSKIISEKTLLDNVNLKVEKGNSVGLIGRNGSGKTVLLKVISGLYNATKGTVKVNGKLIGKDIDFPDSMGIMIESPGFISSRSGYENLRLLAGIKKKANKNYIHEIMARVGLDPQNRKKVGKYSLGMKQRLGLAQAIMEDPELLILDEPFNGLDQSGISEMREYLSELKQKGVTMVIATHSMEDIELLCDEAYIIEAGKVTKRLHFQ